MANRGEGSNDHRAQAAIQARFERLVKLEAEKARLKAEEKKARTRLDKYVKTAAGNTSITINTIRDLQNFQVLLQEKRDWRGQVRVGRISDPEQKRHITDDLRRYIGAHNSTHLGRLVDLIE